MKVYDKRRNESEWFKNLLVGDAFMYMDKLYIKTGVSTSEPNSVELETGLVDFIRLDADVVPVNAVVYVFNKEEGDAK